jgi:integrase/recombinase XerC
MLLGLGPLPPSLSLPTCPLRTLSMTTMSHELAPIPRAPRSLALVGDVDLVAAFLAGRKPTTLAAYKADLADFAKYLGTRDAGSAVELLVSGSAGQANVVAMGYKAHLVDRKLSPATIARRLAALRSMVKLARTLGRVAWSLEVESPRVETYRDTRGPGREGWRSMLAEAKAGDSPKALRDLALIRLMHDRGLRRGEAVGLDLADVDLEGGTIAVVGKGRTQSERLTVSDPTRRALAAWIAARGDAPGPLFIRLDPGGLGLERLTGRAVHLIVGGLGRRVGLSRPVKPHGLRHEGITRALDASGGNVREVRKFSRHAKVETLLKYDDARVDVGGALSRLISED